MNATCRHNFANDNAGILWGRKAERKAYGIPQALLEVRKCRLEIQSPFNFQLQESSKVKSRKCNSEGDSFFPRCLKVLLLFHCWHPRSAKLLRRHSQMITTRGGIFKKSEVVAKETSRLPTKIDRMKSLRIDAKTLPPPPAARSFPIKTFFIQKKTFINVFSIPPNPSGCSL